MYNEILEKLKNHEQFHERRFREKYLSKLALRRCGLENKEETKNALTLEELADFAHTYTSYDRLWRKCLLDYPALRGLDWEDRREYEEKKMLELEYSPGYHQDIKKLNTLY